MDNLKEFEICDVINIESYQYSQQGRPGLGTIEWLMSTICIPKKANELAFKLNPKNFFASLNIDHDLLFIGGKIGTSGGDPIVRWSVDENVSLSPGVNAHVVGQFDTVLRKVTRHTVADCSDPGKTFGVKFDVYFTATNVIEVSSAVGSTRLENIGITAEGGRKFVPPVLTVSIDEDRSDCGVGAFPGGVALFWAGVTGADRPDIELKWSVSGDASILGPDDDWLCKVTLGTSGTRYEVTLRAGSEGATNEITRAYVPETEWSARIKDFVCRLRALTWVWTILVGYILITPFGPICIACGRPISEFLVRLLGAATLLVGGFGLWREIGGSQRLR